MLAATTTMPFSEFAAYCLVAATALTLALMVWPLIRPAAAKSVKPVAVAAPAHRALQGRGLPGQWEARARELERGFERQRAAMTLHRAAVLRLGAIEHEFEHLLRETRLVLRGSY